MRTAGSPTSKVSSLSSSPSSRSSNREAGEEHDRREHGRADRVALRDRLRRVADRVERVGDVADLLGQVGHLGDAAGVVGDRAEGVERDDQAGQRELAHDRDADAVDALGAAAGELPGGEDAEHEHERRQRRGLQALREALDDVRRVAGLRRRGGLLDRAEARRRVVVGDDEQQRGDADADQRAEVQVADRRDVDAAVRAAEAEAVHQPLRDRVERDRGDDAGDDEALVERALDVARGRRTAKVPMIDAMIATPPSTSGYSATAVVLV